MNNNLQLVLKSSTTEMSLNDHDSGIYIVPELNGLTGLPDIRTTSGVNAGYDGGWTSAQNYDARSITLRGVIANEDKASVERMRKQLVSLLGQGKNEELTLDIVTEAGSAYEIQVRTIACEMAMQRVLTQQEFMIQLRADDPLIYDNTEAGEPAIVQVQKALGGFQIPFEIPLAIGGGEDASVIDNHGLEQVAPIVKMYGALHNPKIINQTTNQYMQIEADLGYAEGAYTDAEQSDSGQYISFDAPIAAPLSDFSLKGNTTQQTYTGKNLLKLPATATANNVTFTNNGDGTFNISTSGTASAHTEFAVVVPLAQSGITGGQSYAVSSNATISSSAINLWVHSCSSGGAWAKTLMTFTSAGTRTAEAPSTSYIKFVIGVESGKTVNFSNVKLQLEAGSTATSFEPYVGGIPAPNPDYPQAVQTVTGEQTITICGKNLVDINNFQDGSYTSTTGEWISYGSRACTIDKIPVKSSSTYVVDNHCTNGYTIKNLVDAYKADGTFISRLLNNGSNGATFTTTADTAFINLTLSETSDTMRWNDYQTDFANGTIQPQIELGSTATAYEPYQGQSYTISLGSIELCKMGTYQDYIWKDGDTWKIHKAIGKITLNGSETYTASGAAWWTGLSDAYAALNTDPDLATKAKEYEMSDYFSVMTLGELYSEGKTGTIILRISGQNTQRLILNISGYTKQQLVDWITANKPSFYYWLATATDTTITNATLIAQLEAILNSGSVYKGTNNITTVIAAGNAQGEVQVSYYTHQDPATRDEIIIDSRLRTITLNGLDIYDKKTDGSEFLMLAPGENKLMLQSDIDGDNGYAEVNYKQGYLSI